MRAGYDRALRPPNLQVYLKIWLTMWAAQSDWEWAAKQVKVADKPGLVV